MIGVLVAASVSASEAGAPDPSASSTATAEPETGFELPASPRAGEVRTNPKVVESAVANPNLGTLGYSGWAGIGNPLPDSDFIPIVDRHRIGFPNWTRYDRRPGEYPYQNGRWYDPYNLNVLKGDFPILGQHTFLTFTFLSDTVAEFRRLPHPDGVNKGAFVGGDQMAVVQNWVPSFDLIHGEAAFKPADWEFKFTPVFNIHYFDSNKVEGQKQKHFTNRDGHVAIQELFLQYKLADVSPNYDTIAVRAGIQGFVSDFRGFIFADNDPGVRLFWNSNSNRDQYNVVFFKMLDKDTFTGLNTIFASKDQNVFIANYTRQDFIWEGYNTQLDFLFNNDNHSFKKDDFGNQVRPANVGTAKEHNVNVAYFGWTGDGHIGWLNVDHALYEAYGHDSFNSIAAKPQTIDAQMAALELSIDDDWRRYRVSFFYGSGDSNPTDRRATGFAAILDNPNFAGDGFSYWGREGVPFPNTGVNLKNRFTLLPSLEPSTTQGQQQANFVNPGIFLYNAAMDIKLTPEITITPNVNYIQFANVGVLQLLTKQTGIGHDVGLDWGVGMKYKPLLIDNVIFTSGFAALSPFSGYQDIYRGRLLMMGFGAMDFVF